MKSTIKVLPAIVAVCGLLSLFAGCAGGGSSTIPDETGDLNVNIIWPEAKSRLIPTAANSIKVTISDGATTLFSTVIARPNNSATLPDLPLGDLTVTAQAFPNADGTGVAQAGASQTVTIVSGTNNNISLTMASTIDSIVLSGATSVTALGTGTVIATPKDSGGNTVMVTPGNIVFTSSNPLVASVNPVTGLVTGILMGSATITATESESNKTANVNMTVNLGIGVSPSSASVSILGTKLFSASIAGSLNTAVTWSVVGGAGNGSINVLGLYTAPATPGTYTVKATSVADPTKSATATISVSSGSGTVTVH